MPEFWHLYAVQLAPEVLKKPAQLNRIKALSATIGKGKMVAVRADGKEIEDFDKTTLSPAVKDQVVPMVARAWIAYDGKNPVKLEEPARNGRPKIEVQINAGLDQAKMTPPRVMAMKYAEDLSVALRAALTGDAKKLLEDRYRRALLARVNEHRKEESLGALDDSRVLLAHPKLNLYVDQDSKHPMESIGCTSCHDGSGQETNFVLAAHVPRPIWVDQKTGAPVLPRQIDASKVESHHGRIWGHAGCGVSGGSANPEEYCGCASGDRGTLGHGSAREGASESHDHPATRPTTAPAGEAHAAPAHAVGEAPMDYQTGAAHDAGSLLRSHHFRDAPGCAADAVLGATSTRGPRHFGWFTARI
jgi:hypothetical protein